MARLQTCPPESVATLNLAALAQAALTQVGNFVAARACGVQAQSCKDRAAGFPSNSCSVVCQV